LTRAAIEKRSFVDVTLIFPIDNSWWPASITV